MTWHVFALVWGEPFMTRFAELSVRFLAMPGNIPALARTGPVTFHAYTDLTSREALSTALSHLSPFCKIDVRLFDDTHARRFSGPSYKYEVQRWCVRDLAGRLDGGSLVFLDSNFMLADGTLAALAERRAQGFKAVSVTPIRVSSQRIAPALPPLSGNNIAIAPRPLFHAALSALHHATSAFFVDADSFTPYPSQISWRVGPDGFVTCNFLPHPLMVPISPALLKSQSTADYDMCLRLASDSEIHMVSDSDEMLVLKYSDDDHISERGGLSAPTAREIGFFILCATNHRHRIFADTPTVFHANDLDARYAETLERSRAFVAEAYDWVESLTARPGVLEAKTLMYLKSYLGPIEDFMSPQLEPSMMGRLP